jgi:hypothetical protein
VAERSRHQALQTAFAILMQARCANAENRTTRARRACFHGAEARDRDARTFGRSIRATSSKASHLPALNVATAYVPKPLNISIRPPTRDQ